VRISFDTNILIYAVDPSAGPKQDRAKRLLERATEADTVLTLQALGEFVHTMRRRFKTPWPELRPVLDLWREAFPVAAAEIADYDAALAVCADHGLSFWDSMLWATANRAGCAILLTEDLQDGRRLEGVTFVNPFDPANDRLIDAVLPP